jgi:Fructose-bisphosphate aldolase class-II
MLSSYSLRLSRSFSMQTTRILWKRRWKRPSPGSTPSSLIFPLCPSNKTFGKPEPRSRHSKVSIRRSGGRGNRRHRNRIAQIKLAAQTPLTLHGGSGTDDHDLRKAIAAGISIIHINTELRIAWRRGLEEGLRKEPDGIVPYKILPFAVESVKQVTSSRLRLFNTMRQAA